VSFYKIIDFYVAYPFGKYSLREV